MSVNNPGYILLKFIESKLVFSEVNCRKSFVEFNRNNDGLKTSVCYNYDPSSTRIKSYKLFL